jgi:hypothetical protein
MENIFLILPVDILTLIYMYDNTYHIKFKEVIIQINAQRRFDDEEDEFYYPYGSHSDYDSFWDNRSDDSWSIYSGVPVYEDSEDEINIGSYRSLEQIREKLEQFRQELEMLKFEKGRFEELMSENNNTIDHRYRNYKNSNKKFTKIQKYKFGMKSNNKKNKNKEIW